MVLDKVSIGQTHCVLQLQTQCFPHLSVLLMTVTGTRENVRHRGSGEHGLQIVVLPLMSFKSAYTYFRTCPFLASQLKSSVGSISSPKKQKYLSYCLHLEEYPPNAGVLLSCPFQTLCTLCGQALPFLPPTLSPLHTGACPLTTSFVLKLRLHSH